jgi:hypothetical protein
MPRILGHLCDNQALVLHGGRKELRVKHFHWSMSSFMLPVIMEFSGIDWRMMHVMVAF